MHTISMKTVLQALAIILVSALITIQRAQAQTFTSLHNFVGSDGASPWGTLVQGTDGNFHGTTHAGGTNSDGTIFTITPSGTLTTQYSFCSQTNCTDGDDLIAGLVQATNGIYYGTTYVGGANNVGSVHSGTVFKITATGTPTTLYNFCSKTECTDGENPGYGGLIQAANGDLYGTTMFGGTGTNGEGTIFKITPSGSLSTLYNFCSKTGCADGAQPFAGLIQATDGDFYGTTYAGGANRSGTVFKITPSGKLATLYNFCSVGGTACTDGSSPQAGLIQATDGNFYGTTYDGGANGSGTVFKITPKGTRTTLHSFCSQTGCTDGYYPWAGLIQATDGNFYGTTSEGGGATSAGTVFMITPAGTLTTLHSFDGTDGGQPYSGLVQGTDGNFYGTTSTDAGGNGTVFKLSMGLGPFLKTQTTSGTVGAAVKILGSSLTGASSVTFNGTAATTFKVVSNYEITTTVPAGATSGTVQVVTPGGTLKSNVVYTVDTAAPVFSLATGTYVGTQTVMITDATAGAAIHYTTDGKAPTKTSPVYTVPLTVNSTETLEAIAIESGDAQSAVTKATYTID